MGPCIPDRIGIWKCWFLWREENRRTRRKTCGARTKTDTRFHFNMTYVTIAVREHLLNQSHWPATSRRLLIGDENQIYYGEVTTWRGPFLRYLKRSQIFFNQSLPKYLNLLDSALGAYACYAGCDLWSWRHPKEGRNWISEANVCWASAPLDRFGNYTDRSQIKAHHYPFHFT